MNLNELEQVYNALKCDFNTFEEAQRAGVDFKELKKLLRGNI